MNAIKRQVEELVQVEKESAEKNFPINIMAGVFYAHTIMDTREDGRVPNR